MAAVTVKRAGVALVSVAAVVVAILSGCQSASGPSGQTGASTNPDDFLIVDCLLPGQLRQLGQNMTYLTRRQPAKISARECQIRGGEYTASGQTNAATALAVWLPQAQQGDPSAQTFVGEIYEKGLGAPPDYAAAASWYRKAADQGFARAAINLGALYAQGLGVPKDPQQALDWYSKAAGQQSGVVFSIPPSQLLGEVTKLRRELEQKERELAKTQKELEELRSRLESGKRTSESDRRQLEQLRAQLDSLKSSPPASGDARAQDLQRQIAEREAKLAVADQQLADLRASVERLQDSSDAQRKRIADLQQGSADIPPQIVLEEPRLTPSRGESIARMPAGATRIVLAGRAESPVGVTVLSVNGREVKMTQGKFRLEIPTQPSDVRIVATDRNRRVATLAFHLSGPGGPTSTGSPERSLGYPIAGGRAEFGAYHALVIGNDEYRWLPKLETATSDAKAVASLLREGYGFDTTLLLNATRYDILSALNALRERLTSDDNLVIYYAGHGELDRVNQRGNWLPVDAEQANTANWISNATITDLLNAMAVEQLLVVSDSCYSGTLAHAAEERLSGGATESETLKMFERMAHQRSRLVLTSGGIEPIIESPAGSHSLFARSFLELLRTNSGVLPSRELFERLQLQVASAAENLGIHQMPEYAPIRFAGHEAGDFFFVKAN